MPHAPPQHKSPLAGQLSARRIADEQERNRAKGQFYGNALWQKFRLMRLAESPLCVFCQAKGIITAATDVDHIIDRLERPDLALDPLNVRTLCHSCHSQRTRQDQIDARNKR